MTFQTLSIEEANAMIYKATVIPQIERTVVRVDLDDPRTEKAALPHGGSFEVLVWPFEFTTEVNDMYGNVYQETFRGECVMQSRVVIRDGVVARWCCEDRPEPSSAAAEFVANLIRRTVKQRGSNGVEAG